MPTLHRSGFSKVLLSAFPLPLAGQTLEKQQQVYETVVGILRDIAVHTPISSDSVEVKNGQVQHVTSRRGAMAVKAPRAATEVSFLMSTVRGFELQRHCMGSGANAPKSKAGFGNHDPFWTDYEQPALSQAATFSVQGSLPVSACFLFGRVESLNRASKHTETA